MKYVKFLLTALSGVPRLICYCVYMECVCRNMSLSKRRVTWDSKGRPTYHVIVKGFK